MAQIAEGAMAEIHDILHHGTELSIKSANETLTDTNRGYIQREVEQIIREINSIAVKTSFNSTSN